MSDTPAAEGFVLAGSAILMRFRSRVTAGTEALTPDTSAQPEPAVPAAAADLKSNAWTLWRPFGCGDDAAAAEGFWERMGGAACFLAIALAILRLLAVKTSTDDVGALPMSLLYCCKNL